jgi:hypothetical protein
MEAKMKKHVLILALFGWAFCLFAQDNIIKKQPGYIDFEKYFDLEPEEASTEIEITNPLLSFVAKATENEDEELAGLLKNLQLIRVYEFAITPDEVSNIKNRIEHLDQKMRNESWERFAHVRKQDEVTNIYMKVDGQNVAGLTILSVDEEETVFVNIVGKINMESIGKLGTKFNIPKLDSLETEN